MPLVEQQRAKKSALLCAVGRSAIVVVMGIFDGVKIDPNKNPLFSTSSSFFSKEDKETLKAVPPPKVDCGVGKKKKKVENARLLAAMKRAQNASKERKEEEEEEEEEGRNTARRRDKSVTAETKEETDVNGELTDEDNDGWKGGIQRRTLNSKGASASNTKSEEDQREELKRTIFVGNVPMKTKPKELVAFFKQLFGSKAKSAEVVSARIRSVPLRKSADEKDAKVPIRAKILSSLGNKKQGGIENNGAINDSSKSGCNAYIVWKREKDCERAVKKGNMQKFRGNTLRVDFAAKSSKNGGMRSNSADESGVSYDRTKSVFVGNLPFDVSDEEVIEIFTKNKEYKELKTELEAVRVVRDKTTRSGKGIAFVLFKSIKAARTALLLDGFEMGKRELRITKVGVVAPKRGNEVTKSRERVGKESTLKKNNNNSSNGYNTNKRKLNSWEGGRSAKGNKVAKFDKKTASAKSDASRKGGKGVASKSGKTMAKKKKEPRASGKKRPAVALRKAKMKAGL